MLYKNEITSRNRFFSERKLFDNYILIENNLHHSKSSIFTRYVTLKYSLFNLEIGCPSPIFTSNVVNENNENEIFTEN